MDNHQVEVAQDIDTPGELKAVAQDIDTPGELKAVAQESSILPISEQVITQMEVIQKEERHHFSDEMFQHFLAKSMTEEQKSTVKHLIERKIVNCFRDEDRVQTSCEGKGRWSSSECPTYLELMAYISNANIIEEADVRYYKRLQFPVYIYGGAVRDLIYNNFDPSAIKDIDINYLTSFNSVQKLFQNKFCNLKQTYTAPISYIRIGDNATPDEYLEGFGLIPDRLTTFNLEARCNSLSIHVPRSGFNELYIVDPFNGLGIEEARSKTYHAALYDDASDRDWEAWISSVNNRSKLFFRLLKFFDRGYTIDPKTGIVILNYNGKNYHRAAFGDMWSYLKIANASIYFNPTDGKLFQLFEELQRAIAQDGSLPKLTYNFEYFYDILFTKYGLIKINDDGNLVGVPYNEREPLTASASETASETSEKPRRIASLNREEKTQEEIDTKKTKFIHDCQTIAHITCFEKRQISDKKIPAEVSRTVDSIFSKPEFKLLKTLSKEAQEDFTNSVKESIIADCLERKAISLGGKTNKITKKINKKTKKNKTHKKTKNLKINNKTKKLKINKKYRKSRK